MPASVQKLMIHGKDIITIFFSVLIGQLSEEASKAWNRVLKNTGSFMQKKMSLRPCKRYI